MKLCKPKPWYNSTSERRNFFPGHSHNPYLCSFFLLILSWTLTLDILTKACRASSQSIAQSELDSKPGRKMTPGKFGCYFECVLLWIFYWFIHFLTSELSVKNHQGWRTSNSSKVTFWPFPDRWAATTSWSRWMITHMFWNIKPWNSIGCNFIFL